MEGLHRPLHLRGDPLYDLILSYAMLWYVRLFAAEAAFGVPRPEEHSHLNAYCPENIHTSERRQSQVCMHEYCKAEIVMT